MIRVQEEQPRTPRKEMRTYRIDSFCRNEGLAPIEGITTAIAEKLQVENIREEEKER
jgi:hypothetical protein